MKQHKHKHKSFDGSFSFRVNGIFIDCRCVACRDARRRSIADHYRKDLPGRQ